MPDQTHRRVRRFDSKQLAELYAALLRREYDLHEPGKLIVRTVETGAGERHEVAIRDYVHLGRVKQIDLTFDTLHRMGVLAPERLIAASPSVAGTPG